MKSSLFSPKSIVLLIACAALLFSLSIFLDARQTPSDAPSQKSGPGTYSVSAIGHAGFYDFLDRRGYTVKRSKTALSGRLVGEDGTLIVAEPTHLNVEDMDDSPYPHARRLLIVLPKWAGISDPKKKQWIENARLTSVLHPQKTLSLVTTRGEVFRQNWPAEWKNNRIGIPPTGDGTLQLIRSDVITPLVGDETGMLVGEYVDGERRIWILSDPDVLSNHGLGKGDNAAFMLGVVDGLRFWENTDQDAPLVFDESIHGYGEASTSITTLFFRFPFGVVTLLAFFSAILLVWSASGRFGAPERTQPETDFGKTKLIDNSARLLDYAGYHNVVLQRYVRMTLRLAAKALHAPKMEDAALAVWLDRIGKARGLADSGSAILQETSRSHANTTHHLSRLFENARAIHRWKGELLNEHPTDHHHS
ncbi:DUF4350 domain-containing protein [Desulfosarcina sp. OttesenSCG-928-G10]|nr:DUF4350 domain-containing protein [Desulfosarcina sp. OttesenSCG-928-G10]